jgi:hypothetical protein
LQVAGAWQDQVDAAWRAARDDLGKARTWEVWNIPGYLKDAAA